MQRTITAIILLSALPFSLQAQEFVTRSRDTLRVGQMPFYAAGTNAYYLHEQAARGDTSTILQLFQTARNLNFTVVRTWGFFDSPDSLNPAVIQYRPGAFNERALWALDYVVYKAKVYGIRLIIPFVNSWNDYGGMNQYVRWRSQVATSGVAGRKYREADIGRKVSADGGREYEVALSAEWGHDDFYSDGLIKGWFRNYMAMLVNRTNTITGIPYREESAILGWELANEPRSSDRSGMLVLSWVGEMSSYLKSLDSRHLVGTGEEGFDISTAGYTVSSYNNQLWLFDGTAGVSFRANSSLPGIDFASCHVYPESWNISHSGGNAWLRDHTVIARAFGKPMILGEFGVRNNKLVTYSSWLTTALLDGTAGALVWQLLAGPRTDAEGFGIRCPEDATLCEALADAARSFAAKSSSGLPVPPFSFSLHQNFPNPFNGITTVTYALPWSMYVRLEVFSITGARVASLVEGIQSAGLRRELFGADGLASGIYFCTLVAASPNAPSQIWFRSSRKMVIVR